MPIFEYRCEACGAPVSALVLGPDDEAEVRCGACGADRLRRVPSRFATHVSEAQRVDAFDPKAARSPDFYRDSRNIGLAAKRRAKELGVELGSDFETAVEKARTSKSVDDL